MKPRSKSGKTGATELSIQDALRQYMQQAPNPFAITRGAGHTLVYANAAFCRFANLPNGDAIGAPIASGLGAAERSALIGLLDHALHDRVECGGSGSGIVEGETRRGVAMQRVAGNRGQWEDGGSWPRDPRAAAARLGHQPAAASCRANASRCVA